MVWRREGEGEMEGYYGARKEEGEGDDERGGQREGKAKAKGKGETAISQVKQAEWRRGCVGERGESARKWVKMDGVREGKGRVHRVIAGKGRVKMREGSVREGDSGDGRGRCWGTSSIRCRDDGRSGRAAPAQARRGPEKEARRTARTYRRRCMMLSLINSNRRDLALSTYPMVLALLLHCGCGHPRHPHGLTEIPFARVKNQKERVDKA